MATGGDQNETTANCFHPLRSHMHSVQELIDGKSESVFQVEILYISRRIRSLLQLSNLHVFSDFHLVPRIRLH